jgi:hypothetical protein
VILQIETDNSAGEAPHPKFPHCRWSLGWGVLQLNNMKKEANKPHLKADNCGQVVNLPIESSGETQPRAGIIPK